MPDRPRKMYRNGREAVPVFDPGEWFYYRVDPASIQADGFLDPLKVPCPNLSSNRQKFSDPWHVLYPSAKFGNWAVYRFQIEGLPQSVQADGPAAC